MKQRSTRYSDVLDAAKKELDQARADTGVETTDCRLRTARAYVELATEIREGLVRYLVVDPASDDEGDEGDGAVVEP